MSNSLKGYLMTFAVTLVSVAVINRVGFLSNIAYGNK